MHNPAKTCVPQLLEPHDVEQLTKISCRRLKELGRQGAIPGYIEITPRIWRYREDVLARWLEQRELASAANPDVLREGFLKPAQDAAERVRARRSGN